jgi:hypothetical protein
VSALVVVGVVGVAVLIAFFNYRIKIQREAREQQQHHHQQPLHTRYDPFLPPPPTSPAAVKTETPIMADVVIEPNRRQMHFWIPPPLPAQQITMQLG